MRSIWCETPTLTRAIKRALPGAAGRDGRFNVRIGAAAAVGRTSTPRCLAQSTCSLIRYADLAHRRSPHAFYRMIMLRATSHTLLAALYLLRLVDVCIPAGSDPRSHFAIFISIALLFNLVGRRRQRTHLLDGNRDRSCGCKQPLPQPSRENSS